MMDSEINYSKLTTSELKLLIADDDLRALEEFNKRVRAGKVKPKYYSINQARKIVSKNLKMQMSLETDYKKLTDGELKHLMGPNNPKADKEYDRRIKAGKIKQRRITFKDIKKIYTVDKAS